MEKEYRQALYFDLDTLQGVLQVIEKGAQMRYAVELDGERAGARVVTEELDGEGTPISHAEKTLTKDEITNDATYPAALTWLVRGMFGCPLEYSGKRVDGRGLAEQVEQVGEATPGASAPGVEAKRRKATQGKKRR